MPRPALYPVRRSPLIGRRLKSAQGVELFTHKAQRRSRCDQNLDIGRVCHDLGHQIGSIQQMLGIVQHQQQTSTLQEVDHLLFSADGRRALPLSRGNPSAWAMAAGI